MKKRVKEKEGGKKGRGREKEGGKGREEKGEGEREN